MRHLSVKKWFQRFAEKKIKAADVICILAVVICFSLVSQMAYYYDFLLSTAMEVQVPWLIKGDAAGSYYVVDKEKTRVLKIADGELETVIQGCDPEGDTFYYADNICIADNGDIYVLDTGWSLTGFSVESESILRYDKTGKMLGTCYAADYSNIYCDKHRIFGMDVREDQLYFVTADDDGFSLIRMDTASEECETAGTWTMDGAITLIQDFIVDTESLSVYAIDKRGKLLRAGIGAETVELLYELPGEPRQPDMRPQGAQQPDMREPNTPESERIAFYRGGMGENGTVYVTDIASGRLLRFSEKNGWRMETILTGSNMWNVSSVRQTDGTEYLAYINDGAACVSDREGNQLLQFTEVKKSAGYLGRELLFDLLAVLGLLSAVYLLIRGAALLTAISYTNTQKIGLLVICTVVAVSIILVYGLMGQFRDTYRGELLTKLTMISQIVSNSMDEEEIEDIAYPQNFMNDSYQKLWDKMATMVDKDYGYSEDLYCNILRYDGETGYAVAYLDNSIGTYYPLTDDETEEVRQVYKSGEIFQSNVQSETGSYIYVHTPILDSSHRVIGVVSVGTLSDVIDGKISDMTQNIIIAMIMIVLAIMFLFSEVLSFFDLKERYRETLAAGRRAIPMHVVRALVFITFMAFNMATSFLPVYIMGFVGRDMGMPTALANSLPMTLNLIAIGVTSIFCPGLIKRLGFARMAVISGLIALLGDLSMAMSAGYVMIVAGLVLNGIGVGFITNSIHIFIAALSAEGEGENGFSLFNAASISGINCGMLFGSALAERIGQSSVFFVSAGAWGLVALVFVLVGGRLVIRRAENARGVLRISGAPEGAAQGAAREAAGKRGILRFIASPDILKFMLCIQVPYIIMNSFTYYYVPIYGSENGLTENIASLLIIICSLCSVYLSVAATNYLSKRFGSKAIYLSSLLTFAGLLVFAWRMTLPTLIFALVMIGVAGSFGSSTRIDYFIHMKEAVRYGEDNAMGSYDLVDNIGESTGTIIFAGIISIGFRTGILGLIGCVAGLNAIYALTEEKKDKVRSAREG